MHQISKEFPPAMTPLKRASQMQGMKNNKQLQNLLKEEAKEDQNMEEKGCTANVILYVPEDTANNQPAMVYCANAGDSRSVLGSMGKATALSFDHKPTNPSERTRIQRAGGFVNAEGRVNGNLNLSRAIGDLTYKKNRRIPAKEQQITSFPDVRQMPLNAKTDFIVMGCDGIWEFHTN
jgi:protein phosphatase 2C family protein 2/3